MKSYKFAERMCSLNIEDSVYTISITDNLIKRIDEVKAEINSLKNEKNVDAEKIIKVFDKGIDAMLGNGASAKIFAGRVPSIVEHTDLFVYIYESVTEWVNDRVSASQKNSKS